MRTHRCGWEFAGLHKILLDVPTQPAAWRDEIPQENGRIAGAGGAELMFETTAVRQLRVRRFPEG